MTVAVVIVAAGRGLRAGGGLPKQWRPLAGRTVAAWTLEAFRTSPLVGRIALVLHADDMGLAPGYAGHPDVVVAEGGATRDASVRAGLEALAPFAPELVLIHDVARPCVTHDLIARVVEALGRADAAAPALQVTDALWRGEDGRVAGTVDRTGLWRAQTPQGFRFPLILDAHRRHGGGAADDVEVARAAGLDVTIVPGEERNLKITTPEDFARADGFLRDQMDIRTGNGFDVHAFGPGDSVVLCGIPVPHTRGLVGHSDADVGMHALTDAIYGALAEGDIGRHFPPSDPQWKGADSALFLEHAVGRAASRGYRIANADVTLICERPKIGPHATAMQARLEAIMGLEPGRISVKATTSERLGFTGREEGIAAIATVTLVGA
jgi:2-C-methyl-D-erythritol 4-phosphate cytidylyltransferase / 2-C-methyl-D-erythritol 2,4-cyclodiphosphate synthase